MPPDAGSPGARGRCPLPSSCPLDERECFCKTASQVWDSVSPLILVYCPGGPLLDLQCLSNPPVEFVAFCSDDLVLLPVQQWFAGFKGF